MRVGALPRPGRRRLAQQPAPAAGGVRHARHEGGPERRRRTSACSTAGGTRATTGDNGWAIGGRETDPDEAAQDWRDAQDLYRHPRGRDRARATTSATRTACRALARGHAPRDGHARCGSSPRRGCSRSTPSGCTCRRPASTVRARSTAPDRHRGRLSRTMAPRISLALALHNHQPVGNFGWVFAEVYEQAYQPMVEALERHPGVRLALHYTGPLLEWLARRAARVHRAAARARRPRPGRDPRRRLLRAGPGLAAGARPDRPAARGWRDELEALFGRRPRGAWLAERVWEPDLPTSLVAAGYDWTILDDAHFRAAAIPEEDLWGPYTTEDQGQLLRVFGTEQGLRYRIPFRDVDEVIDYLRDARHRGRRPGRDDGRRRREVRGVADDLGALLGRGPLGRAVLRGARGQRRLADDDDAVRLAGRARHRSGASTSRPAPTPRWASGRCRPNEGRGVRRRSLHARAGTKRRPRRAGCAARSGATSRSGTARSTTSTSRCCGCRTRSTRCPTGRQRGPRLDHLYQGQSNDCYWHGLFGGIYISHMRLATYEHLIAAEDLAETAAGRLHAAERATSTWTASTRCAWPTPARWSRSTWTGAPGSAAGTSGPVRHALGRGHAPPARGVPREAARELDAAASAGGTAGAPTADGRRRARPRSTTSVRVKEPGLAARLVYDALRAPVRPRPRSCARMPRPRTGRWRGPTSSATRSTAPFELDARPRAGPS